MQTQNWHFTDMEIDKPDLTTACFGHDPLAAGTLASNGPAKACAVDKIEQFQAELVAPSIDAEEKLFALEFILHLVGDLHQPLHSSDNHDRGGNDVKVIVDGFPHTSRDELHAFWDTQFVDGIATPPAALAKICSLKSHRPTQPCGRQVHLRTGKWRRSTLQSPIPMGIHPCRKERCNIWIQTTWTPQKWM